VLEADDTVEDDDFPAPAIEGGPLSETHDDDDDDDDDELGSFSWLQ
jgi:hypothetical protein